LTKARPVPAAHLPRREDRGRGRGQAGDVRGRLRVRPQLRRGGAQRGGGQEAGHPRAPAAPQPQALQRARVRGQRQGRSRGRALLPGPQVQLPGPPALRRGAPPVPRRDRPLPLRPARRQDGDRAQLPRLQRRGARPDHHPGAAQEGGGRHRGPRALLRGLCPPPLRLPRAPAAAQGLSPGPALGSVRRHHALRRRLPQHPHRLHRVRRRLRLPGGGQQALRLPLRPRHQERGGLLRAQHLLQGRHRLPQEAGGDQQGVSPFANNAR
ncbi:Protein of unknown function, partial [Gryllus bimaculatus]